MNYVVLLGGNIGDRVEFLHKSKIEIAQRCGSLSKISSIYQTKAWGVEDQQDFLNQVVIVSSTLMPNKFLAEVLQIELDLGRVRYQKWGERVIDIDILFIDDLIIGEEHLKVPHPFLQNRRFTLVPLVEIDGARLHPIIKKSNAQLLKECSDQLEVNLFLKI